ncbi:MAG: biotin/lipoyl-containing protein [Candidatus Gygaella obscura]|nr:biotin/lipoyl-containing protein [Candidatus Gygaella obscura]
MEIKLPVLGENIKSASISFWFVKEGDSVKKDSDIVEVSTDKATFNVPSPFDGVVKKILLKEGDIAETGQTIVIIE